MILGCGLCWVVWRPQVKLLKCLVDNIVVDISFNQMGGLITLNFLEEINNLIGNSNIFKRSIILVRHTVSTPAGSMVDAGGRQHVSSLFPAAARQAAGRPAAVVKGEQVYLHHGPKPQHTRSGTWQQAYQQDVCICSKHTGTWQQDTQAQGAPAAAG